MDNTTKMIKEKLNSKEYDFLRTNEITKNGLCYLTLGGSLSYGTNLPGKGDVDIRGIAMEPELDITKSLLDMDHFEQLLEPETDTVIYGFNKIKYSGSKFTAISIHLFVGLFRDKQCVICSVYLRSKLSA